MNPTPNDHHQKPENYMARFQLSLRFISAQSCAPLDPMSQRSEPTNNIVFHLKYRKVAAKGHNFKTNLKEQFQGNSFQ